MMMTTTTMMKRSKRIKCPHTDHPSQHFAEDHVFAVQPAGRLQHDEELRTVGVAAVVGHGHPAAASVAEPEVLVLKLLAVYTCTCANQASCLEQTI